MSQGNSVVCVYACVGKTADLATSGHGEEIVRLAGDGAAARHGGWSCLILPGVDGLARLDARAHATWRRARADTWGKFNSSGWVMSMEGGRQEI